MAKTVVTQIMFRRFEVTTGNNPDRSAAFNDLAFLRGLLCCRIAGFLCAIVIQSGVGVADAELETVREALGEGVGRSRSNG